MGLRPVITPLDGQVELHEKMNKRYNARKAAGAEGLGGLDMDLASMNRRRKPAQSKLGLFDHE